IILTVAAVFAFGVANAQDGAFKLGAHVGIPMGDIKDASSLNYGLDAAYVWSVADKFKAGVTTGYDVFSGKDGIDDITFLPVAATGQYSFSDKIFGGLDLGYAVGISDNNDGGLLYQPKVGYQAEKFEVALGYKGIAVDGITVSAVTLGFNYKF
ncbi:MAG TPA: hypothetical protein PKH91_10295, partial [Flavobacterium sp.]|nr:hypothetical protein [Flavobacterium sp.]